jgi:hypothetical protein
VKKYKVTLWTDEALYTKAALEKELEHHYRRWRETFIDYDDYTASVYLAAIASERGALAALERCLSPRR